MTKSVRREIAPNLQPMVIITVEWEQELPRGTQSNFTRPAALSATFEKGTDPRLARVHLHDAQWRDITALCRMADTLFERMQDDIRRFDESK